MSTPAHEISTDIAVGPRVQDVVTQPKLLLIRAQRWNSLHVIISCGEVCRKADVVIVLLDEYDGVVVLV